MGCLAPRLIAVFLFVAAAGFHGPASAQDIHPTPSRSDNSTAIEQARRARLARDAGRWVEARAAYKAALDATDPTESTAAVRAELVGELGLCELALRSYRDAATLLASSLEERKLLSPALQRRFDAGMAKAVPNVVTLYLAVRPPDAEVLIDGKSVGRPAGLYRLFLEPGRHFLRGVSSGHGPVFQSLDASAGKDLNIVLTLSPMATSTKETAPGEQKKTGSSTRTPPPPLSKTSPSASALVTTGWILTGASAAASGIFFVWSAVTDADLDELRAKLRREGVADNKCLDPKPVPVCSELRDLQQRRGLLVDAGWITVASSVAIGGATLALQFVGSGRTHKPIGVVPFMTGPQAGVLFYGEL